MKRKPKTGPGGPDLARVGGLAAIGFAGTIVLANVIAAPAGLPLTGADVGEVVTFFGAGGVPVGFSSALTPAAWVLATLFGAGAVAVLWPSEQRRGEAWSLVGFAGVILQNAAFAGVVAIRLGLAATTDPTTAPDSSVTAGLWALHDALFTLNGTFLTLALVGLSVAGRRSELIHAWHARLGLLSAVLLFGSATLAPVVIDHAGPLGLLGLVGWLLWVVWLVAYGRTLIRLGAEREDIDSTTVEGAR